MKEVYVIHPRFGYTRRPLAQVGGTKGKKAKDTQTSKRYQKLLQLYPPVSRNVPTLNQHLFNLGLNR